MTRRNELDRALRGSRPPQCRVRGHEAQHRGGARRERRRARRSPSLRCRTGDRDPLHRVHGRRRSHSLVHGFAAPARDPQRVASVLGEPTPTPPLAEPHLRLATGSPAASASLISSTTRPFCSSCDRARPTADGTFFTCLYATEGTATASMLRDQEPGPRHGSSLTPRCSERTRAQRHAPPAQQGGPRRSR